MEYIRSGQVEVTEVRGDPSQGSADDQWWLEAGGAECGESERRNGKAEMRGNGCNAMRRMIMLHPRRTQQARDPTTSGPLGSLPHLFPDLPLFLFSPHPRLLFFLPLFLLALYSPRLPLR